MNILVCVKIVSQATFSDSLSDSNDRLSGGKLGINPADAYALELALRIKDKEKGTMVTVLTMAPPYVEKSLRDAIAAGADEAVMICDSRAAGSDTLATSKIIAAAIKTLPPQDLILCGKKAIDSETGHIGPQLRVLLDMPLLTNVTSFALNAGTVTANCARDGVAAQYSGALPAILTVCNGTDMVRSPTIMGIRRSKNAVIKQLSLDELNVDVDEVGLEGSPTRTVSVETISFRRGKKNLCNDAEAGSLKLMELLKGGESNG